MEVFKSQTTVRVRYADTDNMGVVYYGNYFTYLEVARTEAMRQVGFSYKEMENNGIVMPVIEAHASYKKSAFYDDLLTITTEVDRYPKAKITFRSTIANQDGETLFEGYITLGFVNKQTGRPTRCPSFFADVLAII